MDLGGEMEMEHPLNLGGEMMEQEHEAREVVADATDPVACVAEQIGRMNIHGRGRRPKLKIDVCTPRLAHAYLPSKLYVAFFVDCCSPDEELPSCDLICMCSGGINVVASLAMPGGYVCWLPRHHPGKVSLQLSYDGKEPATEAVTLEFRVSLKL